MYPKTSITENPSFEWPMSESLEKGLRIALPAIVKAALEDAFLIVRREDEGFVVTMESEFFKGYKASAQIPLYDILEDYIQDATEQNLRDLKVVLFGICSEIDTNISGGMDN